MIHNSRSTVQGFQRDQPFIRSTQLGATAAPPPKEGYIRELVHGKEREEKKDRSTCRRKRRRRRQRGQNSRLTSKKTEATEVEEAEQSPATITN